MSANGHAEQQTLPVATEAQAGVDKITANLKEQFKPLHDAMFKHLDVRKDYIDTLKQDLDARYTAIVNAIDSYGQYVKMAGEQMDRHDQTMETLSDNAGVVGLEAVASVVENGT